MRTYEPNRNLITAVSNRWGSTPISVYAYENDELARRTRRVDNASVTNEFGYNIRSEVIEALMGTNTYDYAYDPIGNRQAYTNNGEALAYLANALNQYTAITNGGLRVLAYDLDGNLTNDSVFAYTWDGENRLTGVTGSGVAATYEYDYMSRRYRKTVSGVTNTFLYDGWNLSQEVSASAGAVVTNVYTWGLDLSGSMQGAGGIGGLLSVTRSTSSGTATYFSCFDANGNLTDYVGTNGTVAAHYEYGPFGGTIESSGTKADDFLFRFSTKYHDDETALYYYGYRYYNPELGRWVNRDPIEERGGICLFAFVQNSPIGYADRLGQIPWWRPWRGCCGGESFNRITHCCRCGEIRDKSEVGTGIRVCHRPPYIGGTSYPHHWIETVDRSPTGFSIGFYPFGDHWWEAFLGPGAIWRDDPASSSTSPHDRGRWCHEIKLSPCEYDIPRFIEKLSSIPTTLEFSHYVPLVHDCGTFQQFAILYAEKSAEYEDECRLKDAPSWCDDLSDFDSYY